MNQVVKMRPTDRAMAFEQAAIRKGVGAPLIIEKDFWVCWVLREVFSTRKFPAPLFKGGTSLSKAYGLIDRFSEDIDLVIDRHAIGFEGTNDPAEQSGSNAQRRALELLADKCVHTVQGTILKALQAQFAQALGSEHWTLGVDSAESQTLLFSYPPALKLNELAGMGYLRPVIRLEFGCRGDVWPTEQRSIHPYLADYFPDLFEEPSFTLPVLAPPRTFWEKATLLHAAANSDKPVDRLSRHYYDVSRLYRLQGSVICEDHSLLAEVVRHKKVFFRSASANYETAVPGTLRLVPGKELEAHLRKDWREMQEMLFGVAPTFDNVLKDVQEIEDLINSSERNSKQTSGEKKGN